MKKLNQRPTEVVSGLGIAPLVFAFLKDNSVPDAWAAVIAVLVAFVPAIISEVVDNWRKTGGN